MPSGFTVTTCNECPAIELIPLPDGGNEGYCRHVDGEVFFEDIDENCPYRDGEKKAVTRTIINRPK